MHFNSGKVNGFTIQIHFYRADDDFSLVHSPNKGNGEGNADGRVGLFPEGEVTMYGAAAADAIKPPSSGEVEEGIPFAGLADQSDGRPINHSPAHSISQCIALCCLLAWASHKAQRGTWQTKVVHMVGQGRIPHCRGPARVHREGVGPQEQLAGLASAELRGGRQSDLCRLQGEPMGE